MKFGTKRFSYDNRCRLMYGDTPCGLDSGALLDLLNTVVDCVKFNVNRKELSEALERFVAAGKEGAK